MRAFSLIFLLWLATPAAATIDLYSARVTVSDQSESARAKGLQQALAVVLVRVTGDPRIVDVPPAQSLIGRPSAFLQGSSYEQDGDVLRLRATFNGQALGTAIRDAGLPMWSASRQSHLLWIGLDGDTPRLLFADDREALPALREAAEARGVPVLLPRGDAIDLDAVKPADVFVGLADPLLKASRRYRADQIVSVWVSDNKAQWSLINAGGVIRQWQSSGADAAAALAEGLQMLASEQAQQFAVRPSQAAMAQTVIEVGGVQTLDDYARVLNYLKKLPLARHVQLATVQGPRLTFTLGADGGETQLVRAIAAGGVLRESITGAQMRGALAFTLSN